MAFTGFSKRLMSSPGPFKMPFKMLVKISTWAQVLALGPLKRSFKMF
jgi:hypothetical protein